MLKSEIPESEVGEGSQSEHEYLGSRSYQEGVRPGLDGLIVLSKVSEFEVSL